MNINPPTPRGISDPYVIRNAAALKAIDWSQGSPNSVDKRIAAALARRGLAWEQPADCWHLTAAGSRVLAALDEEANDGPDA